MAPGIPWLVAALLQSLPPSSHRLHHFIRKSADSNSTACPGTDPSSPSPRLPGPRPPPSPARPLLWSPHQHPNRLRISPQLSSWATLLEPEEMQSLRPSNPPQGTLLSERRQSSCHGPRALQSVVRITSVLIPCCSLYSLASDLLATSMSSGDFCLRSSFSWRDRKSTRLNSSHTLASRMPSSA